jgi:hypothetical protein
MNHVQEAHARGPECLRLVGAAKDAVALEQGTHRHEGVEQHLGGARIRAELQGKLGCGGAFPERREHVELQGRKQHAAFLKGPAGLHQTLKASRLFHGVPLRGIMLEPARRPVPARRSR